MTTILAADVGNTNVVLGVYENAKLLRTWRLATVHDRTEDELAVSIDGLLAQHDLALSDLDALVVGSVVPSLTQSCSCLPRRRSARTRRTACGRASFSVTSASSKVSSRASAPSFPARRT